MEERENLKKRATELGIDFPSNIKTDKLLSMIADKEMKPKTEREKPMAEATIVPTKQTFTMKTSEYEEYSKKNGTTMGRKEGEETECTIEELRVLINSDWTPQQVMDKHGMSEEKHKQLVWKLSEAERRPKPIAYTMSGYKKG